MVSSGILKKLLSRHFSDVDWGGIYAPPRKTITRGFRGTHSVCVWYIWKLSAKKAPHSISNNRRQRSINAFQATLLLHYLTLRIWRENKPTWAFLSFTTEEVRRDFFVLFHCQKGEGSGVWRDNFIVKNWRKRACVSDQNYLYVMLCCLYYIP